MYPRFAGGRLFSGVTLLISLSAGPTTADEDPDTIARAKTHFEAGRALYHLGNYADAVREFRLGYELVPRPQFLLNLGQAYRKQGDLDQARQMYQQYLDQATANDDERDQVKSILAELEHAIAARPPAVAAAVAVARMEPAPPPRRSFLRRHWWVIVVPAVLVVGTAAVVGGVLANQPCAYSLGCYEVLPR